MNYAKADQDRAREGMIRDSRKEHRSDLTQERHDKGRYRERKHVRKRIQTNTDQGRGRQEDKGMIKSWKAHEGYQTQAAQNKGRNKEMKIV